MANVRKLGERMTAETFTIGGEHEVRRLGFGAMRLPTEAGPGREAALAVARRSVELGVTLIDTAHMYGWGANEELLAEALHPYPDDLLVATKVGIAQASPGKGQDSPLGPAELNGRPDVLRHQVDEGLRRLRVERLELLQLHRIDPDVPLADQIGTLRELQSAGKIGHIGLSEVTVDELAEARQYAEIASVQNRYSVLDRTHEPVVEACEAAGIAFLPWRPVAEATPGETPSVPSELAAVADELDATPTQVSLAWLLAHSPVLLPIPGTSSLAHLEENVAAASLPLTTAQHDRLLRLQTR